MGSYIIKVTSGVVIGTIENQIDIGFDYSDLLNTMNEGTIKISSLGSVKRGLLVMGSSVEIFRNGTLEFKGIVDSIDTLDAGGTNIHISGQEVRLAQEKGVYASSPWILTASATINAAIIAESNYFTAGTIDTGVDIDYRLDQAQSLWGALGNLSTKTGQDVQVDYTNDEIDILANRGSLTSVRTFNDGIHIRNMRVSTSYPKGNWVKVFGKGDGSNQIESDDAQGQDATSQSVYGIIKEVIIDRSIMTIAEANRRANIEVAKIKDPTKIYDFDVNNPDITISTGDIITLNSQDKDLTNEEVRITGIQRGIMNNKEFLTMQVANSGYSKLLKTQNQLLGELKKDSVDNNSYMQGSGNVSEWGSGINAKTNYPLKVGFYVSPNFMEDEADNLRIESLTVDYDVDKYQSQFGDASFTGSDPQVQNNSGDTQPDVQNSSGSNDPDVTGTSGTTTMLSLLSTSTDNENVAGTWDNIAVHNITGTFEYVIVTVSITEDSWSGSDTIGIRVRVGGTTQIQDIQNNFSTGYSPIMKIFIIPILASLSSNIQIDMYSNSGYDYTMVSKVYTANQGHSHTDGSFSAANHAHTDGTYNAANHGHPDGSYDINAADLSYISVGDGVGEAGSVNASSVNLYLDYWNGSSWVNKHSILATGSALDNDVDMSNSGTYPDATGYWRVRFEPITATADFIQGIVKIKYSLDN